MRKTLLSVVLLLSCVCMYGQKKSVNAAFSQAKMDTPDFTEARRLINEALVNEETKDDAKTWYVAGFIENKFFELEMNKKIIGKEANEAEMYQALEKSTDLFNKALALDTLPNEKGKVKPRYLKDIRNNFKNNLDNYANAGIYYFNGKDFKKAYDIWTDYVNITKMPIMDKQEMPADSIVGQIRYNAAIAALQSGDHQLAIKALSDARNGGYNENDVYKFLVYEYEQTKDTVNLINTLKEGDQRFKNEMVEVTDEQGNVSMQKENTYILKLINLYIYRSQFDDAIKALDVVIAENPTNADYWNVKGSLYEAQKNMDQAVECFLKAIEISPNMPEALGNLGRIYFNQAIQRNNEISELSDNAQYTKAKDEEVLPLFKKALPYYEKAHSLKPNEDEYMVALRGIYYNLGDAENLKKIEAQMGY